MRDIFLKFLLDKLACHFDVEHLSMYGYCCGMEVSPDQRFHCTCLVKPVMRGQYKGVPMIQVEHSLNLRRLFKYKLLHIK